MKLFSRSKKISQTFKFFFQRPCFDVASFPVFSRLLLFFKRETNKQSKTNKQTKFSRLSTRLDLTKQTETFINYVPFWNRSIFPGKKFSFFPLNSSCSGKSFPIVQYWIVELICLMKGKKLHISHKRNEWMIRLELCENIISFPLSHSCKLLWPKRISSSRMNKVGWSDGVGTNVMFD